PVSAIPDVRRFEEKVLHLMLDGEAPVVNARRLAIVRTHTSDVVEIVEARIKDRGRLEAGRRLNTTIVPVEGRIQSIGKLGEAAVDAVCAAAATVAQRLVVNAEAAAEDRLAHQPVRESGARPDVRKIGWIESFLSRAASADSGEDKRARKAIRAGIRLAEI